MSTVNSGDVDTNAFDTNVIVFPVGIDPTAASHRISYTAGMTGYSVAAANADSVSTPISFGALAPGYWSRNGGNPALVYAAESGTALLVNREPASEAQDRAQGLADPGTPQRRRQAGRYCPGPWRRSP